MLRRPGCHGSVSEVAGVVEWSLPSAQDRLSVAAKLLDYEAHERPRLTQAGIHRQE